MMDQTYVIDGAGIASVDERSDGQPGPPDLLWIKRASPSGLGEGSLVAGLKPPAQLQALWSSPDTHTQVAVADEQVFIRMPFPTVHGTAAALMVLAGPGFVVSASTAPLTELDGLVVDLETGARSVRPISGDLLVEILQAGLREGRVAGFALRDETDALAETLESADKTVEAHRILSIKRRTGGLVSLVEEQIICVSNLLALRGDRIGLDEVRGDVATMIEVLKNARTIIMRLDAQATDLRQAYGQRLQEASNRRLNVLSVVSAIFLPATLIAGIFGMNFEHIPMTEAPAGYQLALAMMLGLVVGQLVFFWWRGWFR